MIVWIVHVKVGHHQTPHNKTPVQIDGGFILCDNLRLPETLFTSFYILLNYF